MPPWLKPDEPDRRIFLSRGSTWKVLLRRCELAAVILVARFCPSKDIHSFKEGRGSQTSPTPTDHGAVQLTQHTGLFWTQLAAVRYESHVHRHLNVSRGYHVPVQESKPFFLACISTAAPHGGCCRTFSVFFFPYRLSQIFNEEPEDRRTLCLYGLMRAAGVQVGHVGLEFSLSGSIHVDRKKMNQFPLWQRANVAHAR